MELLLRKVWLVRLLASLGTSLIDLSKKTKCLICFFIFMAAKLRKDFNNKQMASKSTSLINSKISVETYSTIINNDYSTKNFVNCS